MLNVYDVHTPFNTAQTSSVVAHDMGEAEELFLEEYPMTKILEITLHSEYVIVAKDSEIANKQTELRKENTNPNTGG